MNSHEFSFTPIHADSFVRAPMNYVPAVEDIFIIA